MRAYLTISWRDAREAFPKFLLTVLSVALGVAFLSGTLALRDTLANTFKGIVEMGNAEDVYVRGTKIVDDGSSDQRHVLPVTLEGKMKNALVAGALVEPSMALTQVQLFDKDDNAIQNSGAPVMLMPYINDPLWGELADGRWPVGPREIMLIDTMMEAHGFKIGDRTDLSINGAKRAVTITGSIKAEESLFGAVLIFMDRKVVEPLALPDQKTGQFEIKLPAGASVSEAINQLKPIIPANAVVLSGDAIRAEQAEQIDTQLGFVNTFLLVFVFLSLFIGSFVIANTFAMIVRQRMKQFAMLRAIGAKPSGIFFLVFLQAILVGLVGSALGLVLGMGLLAAISALLGAFGMELGSLTMSSTVMGIGVGIGLLVTIAGALVSAKRAALTDPLDVLRESAGAEPAPSRRRAVVTFALLAAGIGVVALGIAGADTQQVGIGAAFTLLGLLGALPYLAAPVIRGLARLLKPLSPVGVHLGAENLLRNAKRTASTAGALVIGVSLVVAGSAFVSSIQGSVTTTLENSIKSELMLFDKVGNNLGRPIPIDQVKEIEAEVKGIAEIGRAKFGQVILTHDGTRQEKLVSFYEPDMTAYVNYKLLDGDDRALLNDDVVIVKTFGSDWENYQVGDEIQVQTPLGRKRGRVGAIIESSAMDFGIVLPLGWADSLIASDTGYSSVLINLEQGVDAEQVKADINSLIGKEASYQASNKEDLGGQSGEQLARIEAILYGLLALSVITAVVGIINTLVLSVMDRVREIGMVRAIGMSRRQLIGMITLESLLTTVFGLLVGLTLGLGLAWAVVQTLAEFGISAFVLPVQAIGTVTVGAFIVAILAAVIPARQAARINELQAMAR